MKIALLAAHPDDIEFGMGATVSKLLRQGHDVRVYCFSHCGIRDEFERSMKLMGIKHAEMFQVEVRTFPNKRQGILQRMIDKRNDFMPDVVYLPSSHDMHQDHEVIYKEGIRAFKHSTIYGYSFSWNNLNEDLRHFEIVERKDVDNKQKAINCYQSQQHRYYHSTDYILSELKVNGRIINQKFAEKFELIRSIK
jgi:LmbE family N-acetylglucosaminyl deacetylase